MDYIGFKMQKSEFDNDKALEIAMWCTDTQTATWQDMGDYYECVPVEVDKVARAKVQIEKLESDYETAKHEICKYYMDAIIDGDVDMQKDLQAELQALQEQYSADVTAVMNTNINDEEV